MVYNTGYSMRAVDINSSVIAPALEESVGQKPPAVISGMNSTFIDISNLAIG